MTRMVHSSGTARIALITGASSGIGAALAVQLAGEGWGLALFGRDARRLHEVAERCRAKGAQARTFAVDVTDRAGMARAVEEVRLHGVIDLFIANAGILQGRARDALIEDGPSARTVLDTNLVATIDTLHLVLAEMTARGAGRIVLVSSLAGLAPLADAPAYSAAKAGLVAYGLALREALAGTRVEVCVACPGYVDTAMARRHIGWRPGEITAEDAARRILAALRRGREISGFPFGMYRLARMAVLVPGWLRRPLMRRYRFHVQC